MNKDRVEMVTKEVDPICVNCKDISGNFNCTCDERLRDFSKGKLRPDTKSGRCAYFTKKENL